MLCAVGFAVRTSAASRRTPALLEDAAQKLARAGLQVSEVELPAHFARLTDVHLAISSFEFSRNFTYEIEHHWEKISTTLRENRLKSGLECSFERYSEARLFAAQCRREFAGVVENYDVLLTASATGEAPVGLNATGNAITADLDDAARAAVTMPVFRGRRPAVGRKSSARRTGIAHVRGRPPHLSRARLDGAEPGGKSMAKPLLQTTIAGSLPKPAWLAKPNQLWAPWLLEGAALAEAKRDATRLAIREQELAGIDIVTDGEQSRRHFVTGYLEHLGASTSSIS